MNLCYNQNMNIEMQCCGMLMLIVLMVIIIREKHLDISSRRMFVHTMCSCIACLSFDILSVVGIVYATQGAFPRTAALLICKIYLVFLVNLGYAGLRYASAEFFEDGSRKIFRTLYRIIFTIGIIFILALPIEYYHKDRVVYSFGPSTVATYILAFILFITTIIMAFVVGNETSARRRRSILLWQCIWLIAALMQLAQPALLVVGFAAAFGIVLVYAELENPNEGIDRITGQFTETALQIYLMDMYQKEISFASMHVKVDYGAGEADLQLEKKAMRSIAEFLDDNRGSYVFRESKEDFIVIFKSRDLMEQAYRLAVSQLEKAVELPVNIYYTLIPDNTIFKTVDEFLQYQHYIDKNTGLSGSTIVAGEEQAEQMRSYLRTRDTISWALQNNTVEVYYQPIYSLKEQRFTSAEALVRIRDSEGRMVMPGQFIPIAEENGLIIPLGVEVFRQVCELLSTGRLQQLGIDYVEVNLSMAQFRNDDPAGFVQDLMERYSIDPDWINLEITETVDPSARQVVLRNMETLIKRGVSFSLDDFGTGRSNLDYFVYMPVSIIKFDYTFTRWYFESEKARKVLMGIVSIINEMGLSIVAEGVETEEQLEAMKQLGASYIQGFYFSRPLPQDRFLEYISTHQPESLQNI